MKKEIMNTIEKRVDEINAEIISHDGVSGLSSEVKVKCLDAQRSELRKLWLLITKMEETK